MTTKRIDAEWALMQPSLGGLPKEALPIMRDIFFCGLFMGLKKRGSDGRVLIKELEPEIRRISLGKLRESDLDDAR